MENIKPRVISQGAKDDSQNHDCRNESAPLTHEELNEKFKVFYTSCFHISPLKNQHLEVGL